MKISTLPDVGVKSSRTKLQSVLHQAVNIEPSHYTHASFHSHSFCSLEGRGGEGGSVLFQAKTTKSFNCVMKKNQSRKGELSVS